MYIYSDEFHLKQASGPRDDGVALAVGDNSARQCEVPDLAEGQRYWAAQSGGVNTRIPGIIAININRYVYIYIYVFITVRRTIVPADF